MSVHLKNKLRNIKLLKLFYRKIKTVNNEINDRLIEYYYKLNNKNIIYSYFARVNNFGDLFNYDLINFFGYKLIYKSDDKKSNAALLGSILQMYTRAFDGYILGSGFIHSRFNRFENNWKVKLIRGPLSLAQCNPNEENIIYGDPGILASILYKTRAMKKFKLGIVPHSSDYDKVKNKFGKNIKVINARNNPKKVAYEIQQCELIASSSLHGLIFADSYRIPNVHLKFGNDLIGGHHKFKDYYLGMGVTEYDYIDYNINIKEEFIKSQCILRFSQEKLLNKQQEIINVYKKILNEITKHS